MTSSASEKINRSSGKFVPDQGMVGYLLGKKCQALHTLAKECDDGVFIHYNNKAQCFDIQARSVSGVRTAITKLKARQAEGQKEKREQQEQESKLVQAMVTSVASVASVALVVVVAVVVFRFREAYYPFLYIKYI